MRLDFLDFLDYTDLPDILEDDENGKPLVTSWYCANSSIGLKQ